MNEPPLHRFEEYGRLSASEREAVAGLAGAPYGVPRGHSIAQEGVATTGFFRLLSGWAAASHVLPNGSRQIMKIHLPGDALGTPSIAMKRTTESLVAITDVVVAKVTLADFGRLFEAHPRIAARFMLSIQQERIALMDRLIAIGRTSAEARVAGFLLDLSERLAPLGLVEEDGFDVWVTQEQIGDVLGLTAVHVNRMVASLIQRGLVERNGRRYRLPDPQQLAALAARPLREPYVDQPWLPAPR